jgi:DNA modification methylase
MFEILHGDCRDRLADIEKESVQCCVTSPPYWHLRDYQCKEQIGNDPTPEEYAKDLVDVFQGVHRVLKQDGVLFLNLGDTYCGGGGYCPNAPSNRSGSKQSTNRGSKSGSRPVPEGYKAKDLVGFPWLMAFKLREAGWYLRADIIWDKTNCMPENVTDRPTRSHEYVFLLSKSPKYFFDHKIIREVGANGKPRNQRTIWAIPKAQSRTVHTAVFPEALVERCVLAGSREGDTVLDPFAGSGTTGVVSMRLGRIFVGIELNEDYCEVCEERLSKASP